LEPDLDRLAAGALGERLAHQLGEAFLKAQFALTVEIGRAAARSQVFEALGSGARSSVRRQPR
jgi:hypothetical protein